MRLTGSLAEHGFPALVQQLHEGRWTGTVTLTHMGVGKSVTVQEGRLVFASSSDPDDRLGELLLRQGKVKLWDLVEANAAVGPGKRLGAVLVERGVLGPENLIKAVTQQTQEILYSLFQWTEGRYRLQPGPAGSETITLKISTPDVIMEGIRRIEAWSRIERGIGGLGAQYARAEHYENVLAQMSLSLEKLSLLTDLNGIEDVRAICEASSLADFEVCRALWAFRVIGAVRLVGAEPARPEADEDGLASALEAGPEVLPAASQPVEETPEPAAKDSAKQRILVVGLEREAFEKIDPLLSRAVFDVERAPQARAAAAVCRRIRFDLVLVRHPLPDMALKDFVDSVWKDGAACAASHLLVLADEGRLAELDGLLREGQGLALPVTEPRRLLEEVACRLLGVTPRTSARLVVKLIVQLDEGKRLVVSQTENVSEAGMLLRTDTLYPLGTRLSFESLLPGDRAPIQGEAEIVRHAIPELELVKGVGMRILSFKGDSLKRLGEFLKRNAASA